MLATVLVLVAALLHAAWNTLIKFSGERLLVVACMDSVAMLFVALMLPFLSLPPVEIWPWILASAAFELLYRYLLIQAYRVGDLGLVYPLMRGLSPLVVLALTLIFAGEVLTTQQILGILLIPFGMLCLLWQGGGGGAVAVVDATGGGVDRSVYRLLHLHRRAGLAALVAPAGLPDVGDANQCLAVSLAGAGA